MADRKALGVRTLVEALVIVGSILLAFGIDAWWDGLQDRQAELELLEVLERDLLEHQSELSRVRASLREALAVGAEFSSSSPTQLAQLSQDSAVVLLSGLGSAVAFTVFKGNLDRADLSIVSSADLRAGLASWSSHAEDLAENAPRDLDALRRVALRAGAGQLGLFGAEPGDGVGAESLAALRADAEFLSLLDWQQALRRISAREASTLDGLTTELVAKIRSQMDGDG